MLMSDKMKSLFMRQIAHELNNSVIYRKISNFLSVKGFSNLASRFKKNSEDKVDHSWWLQDFLEKLNIEIDLIQFPLNVQTITLTNFVELALQREIETTKMINEMLGQSYEESGIITDFLLSTMLREQTEEIEKVNTLNDEIINIGGNVALLQLFDKSLS